jgi:cytosine/adenosine deaminase-related metal-dependent hydrolase
MPSSVIAVTARWAVVPGPCESLDVIDDATILVRGNRIVDVVRAPVDIDGARHIEVRDGILLPGFVNLHNHSINGPIFRGIFDDLESSVAADSVVYSVLLPLGDHVSEVLTDDEIAAIYRLAVTELVRGGTTTVLDMPRARHSSFLAVAGELGLRAIAAPYIFSHLARGLDRNGQPAYRDVDEEESFAAALRVAEQYDEGTGGRIRVGFGPHATDTCSPALLRRIGDAARERDAIVTIHVAQSRLEVDAVRRRYGVSPVELLHDTGVLGPNVVAAHCVHATDGELDILRDTGTTVANCPLTFARSGIPVPFDRFHRRGVPTGIGTDAYNFDFFAEMRAAGFISKLATGDSGSATASTLLRAATTVGARALGEPSLGRIAPGCVADLIVVGLGQARLQPVRDPIKNLVWNATPRDVALVMIDGEIVVDDGVSCRADERRVIDEAAAAVEKLWSSAERAGILAVPTQGAHA